MDKNLEKFEQVLSNVVNPVTGNTLSSELRWKDFSEKGEQLIITYNRDGIPTEQKRKIEDNILSALIGLKDESQVMVKTVSTDFDPQQPSDKASEQAQLKTGHGVIGNKKRIEGVGKVIAVSSCKGGVGKSTVTVNLALALRNLGAKVGILDADIYGPSVPMLLGEREATPKASEKKKIKPIETKGIKFISFGLFISEKEAVIWRGPMLGGVLNQFLFDTEWGELDYLILDLPPGTGDIQLSMVQNTEVDLAVVVTTPQSLALLDTRKGVEMFKKVNTPVAGLIENMSYFVPDDSSKKYYIFGQEGGAKLAADLEIDFLADIPLEMALREGSDLGLPYMDNPAHEGRPVWKSYMQIASKLDKITKRTGDKGFFGKLFKK